jgi:hypothetical protein
MLNKINISPDRQKLIVYLVLTIVTLAVFWQVNQYHFINCDDPIYVTENSHVQSGITLDGFLWAFSTTYAEFWHPLTWLSLMFDYQLHGLNAGGYHLTNLILHVMSALLLFWLFNRMTGTIWRSAFVAAIFALHPLHVESVAWIAERKDVLSAFFWMLTLCFYVYYTEKPIIKRYLLVLFSFACALMSKSMVVTLPVVMILLDYWPLDRLHSREIVKTIPEAMPVSTDKGKKKNKLKKAALKKNISPPHDRKLSELRIGGIIPLWQLKEKTPFFILSAFCSFSTVYAQFKPSVRYYSLGSRIANAPVSFVTYLEKTFWPHDLTFFYPFSDQLRLWQVLGSVLLILVMSTAIILAVKRLPYLFVGWFWYAITIAPVIGIIQIGDHVMADRYTYLPSVGIAVMLAWGISSLIKSEDLRKKILFPSGIAVLAIIAVLTWKQCSYWKNSIELFKQALQVTEANYKAHANLGLALFNEGKIEEAIDHYNQAIRIEPNYNQAYYNRGTIYTKLGQYQRAIKDYNEAIRIKPDYSISYNNRGAAYLLQGNNALGCRDVQKACELGICKTLEAAKSNGICR